MSVTSFIQNSALKVFAFSLLSLGSLTITSPSLAASLKLDTWSSIGDAVQNSGQATLTNTFPGGIDDVNNDYNLSGSDPASSFDIETFLDLNPGDIGLDATEGSAIKTYLTDVKVGDVFSFDFDFSTYDTVNSDRAFVTINNSVIPLSGSTLFSHTFTTAGTYKIGFGIVDANDYVGSSRLSVSNANYQAVYRSVPEPSPILGCVTLLACGVIMQLRLGKKTSA